MADPIDEMAEKVISASNRKGDNVKRLSRECDRVLGEYIRPAITRMSDKLKTAEFRNVKYGAGNEPFLEIVSRLEVTYELRYTCDGNTVEIVTTRSDRNQSEHCTKATDAISHELVAEQIGRFLRQALGIEMSLE